MLQLFVHQQHIQHKHIIQHSWILYTACRSQWIFYEQFHVCKLFCQYEMPFISCTIPVEQEASWHLIPQNNGQGKDTSKLDVFNFIFSMIPGDPLLTEVSLTSIRIRILISNHFNVEWWIVITYPCPNLIASHICPNLNQFILTGGS